MFSQWPALAIQAFTTARGVRKPVAMFSPAAFQAKPTREIRAAKSAPWVKDPVATIVFVHPCAERSRRLLSCSLGRRWAERCLLIRQTTALFVALREAEPTGVSAFAQ